MIQVGKPVSGNDFIGREKEIAEIVEYLKMGQSVVIIAPRRFGKTSLILEVIRRVKKEKYYTGYIDLFAHATLPILSKSIISEVLDNHGLKKAYQQSKGSVLKMFKNLKLKAVIEDFEFIIGMEENAYDEWNQFIQSIDFINSFAITSKKQIIFTFDEYGDILKFKNAKEIIKLMRAKIQNQHAATYLFSGSYESVMDTLFVSNKSPFYRLTRIINLGYLPYTSLRKYMLSKCKRFKLPIQEKLIEDLIDFLRGHPYYCQLSLQQIYLYYQLKRKLPGFDDVIELIVDVDKNYLIILWEELSSNREYVQILKYLTTSSDGVYRMAISKNINASRSLNKLMGKGILYQKDRSYLFYDPIFEYWIRTQING